ncbi:MAG: hypothetical protein QM770_23810 [Tepidisphaeraceae bacterium]
MEERQQRLARQLKLSYATRPPAAQREPLIFKRLFKHADATGDHELMAAFLVATDRLIRRKRRKRVRWAQGTLETSEVLRVASNYNGLFRSNATNHYVRRRAWRHFRRLGFRDPATYRTHVAAALARYDDADVRAGENLLDCWGLMHACFGKSKEIAFDARHTNIAPSGVFANLSAAPMFERHWADAAGLPVLLDLLLAARCRPVRVWAIQLLKRLHKPALCASMRP